MFRNKVLYQVLCFAMVGFCLGSSTEDKCNRSGLFKGNNVVDEQFVEDKNIPIFPINEEILSKCSEFLEKISNEFCIPYSSVIIYMDMGLSQKIQGGTQNQMGKGKLNQTVEDDGHSGDGFGHNKNRKVSVGGGITSGNSAMQSIGAEGYDYQFNKQLTSPERESKYPDDVTNKDSVGEDVLYGSMLSALSDVNDFAISHDDKLLGCAISSMLCYLDNNGDTKNFMFQEAVGTLLYKNSDTLKEMLDSNKELKRLLDSLGIESVDAKLIKDTGLNLLKEAAKQDEDLDEALISGAYDE